MKLKRNNTRQSSRGNQNRPKFSYYSNVEQASDAVRQRQQVGKQRQWLIRLRLLPSILAIGVILGSVVYSTTLSSSSKVIMISDTSPYRSQQEYQLFMEELLARSILAKSKLTINTGHLEADFIKEFPEVHVAKLSLPVIGRRTTLTLQVRKPIILMTTKTGALIVDSDGKAVMEPGGLNSSSLDSLLKLQDESGLDLKTGDQALSLKTINFIKSFNEQMAASDMSIVQLTLPPRSNEVDVKLKDTNYFIKCNLEGDAKLQAGAFLAVRAKLAGEGAQPQEYIDVRVDEKVFYR